MIGMTIKKSVVKYFTVLILCILTATLALGCTPKKEAVKPQISPSPAPAPTATPEPESVPGKVIINGAEAVYQYFDRDASVNVVGETEDYYVIIIDENNLLVEKRLIALEDETRFEAREVYAKSNVPVYSDFYLSGEPIKTLKTNTIVKIHEKLGYCYLCEIDGLTGYISVENVSDTEIKISKPRNPSSQKKPSNHNSSKGNESNSSQDGGEIELSSQFTSSKFIPNSSYITLAAVQNTQTYPTQGAILADSTPAFLRIFDRDQVVKVIDEDEDNYILLVYGQKASIARWQVRLENESAYSEWQGFAMKDTAVYDDFRLLTDPVLSPKENDKVQVLEDLSDIYLIALEDGTMGYVQKSKISEKQIEPSKTYKNPSKRPGSSSSSSSSSGNSSSSSSQEDEWTTPKL